MRAGGLAARCSVEFVGVADVKGTIRHINLMDGKGERISISGASGLSRDDGWVDINAVAVPDIVYTNGAGDAFFARFAAAWPQGSGLAAAMRDGAEATAAAVQPPGLVPPSVPA